MEGPTRQGRSAWRTSEGGAAEILCIHSAQYIDMSSKNISVRDDVYRALKEAKAEDESFSDVIERLLGMRSGEHPLYGLIGTLDESEAEEVRERVAEFRASVDEDVGAGE